MNHEDYMKLALDLADRGSDSTLPNPAVGAILVKGGKIIGRGYHKGPGTLHGEIDAIESSSESVEGAVLYTTLEPCCTMYKGKHQPPCTGRIIKEKISRVIIASEDPNEKVSGKGAAQLREAGIAVQTGVLDEENRRLNEEYFFFHQMKRPFVHLKIAQTIDGRIAVKSGDSKWITDDTARSEVHDLRARSGAVLVGSATVRTDNPRLTVRNGKVKGVRRIILSGNLNIPEERLIYEDLEVNPTTIITSDRITSSSLEPFRLKGIEIIQLPSDASGRISPELVLESLYEKGIVSLLVEGGAGIFTTFLQSGLYDRISVYIAPKICGDGINSIGDLGTLKMSESLQLKDVSIRPLNDQIVISGYRS